LRLRQILEKLAKGEITVDEAEREIKLMTIEEVGDAVKLDVGREFRRGVPEIILAEYKTNDVLLNAIKRMVEASGRAIVSRLRNDQIELVKGLGNQYEVMINEVARIAVIKKSGYEAPKTGGKVGIVTGGTADIPVAEEARIIAEELGCTTITAYDVGIAGIQRAIRAAKKMIEEDVDVIIAVAGMEGALPSAIRALVDVPVIGVPTSIGYGIGGKGIAALLSMLQSCSLGLLVVNVDNGIGAGVAAATIANRVAKFRKKEEEDV